MKILVTGATGFVGSNLARHLVSLGHEVLGTTFPHENPLPTGVGDLGDLSDLLDDWDGRLEGVEAVFHQAAHNDPQSKDLIGIHKANVVDTARLFDHAHDVGCRKFIYASSTAIYGAQPAPYREDETKVAPLTPYAYSKAAMEEYIHAFHRLHPDTRCCGLRYCNVYGPGEAHKGHRASVIHQIIKTMKEGKRPILFKYGHQRRDWVHVMDVVQANLMALVATDYQDQVFNIGSGGCVTFDALVETINQIMETSLEPDFIDNPYNSTYQDHTECDISHAQAILGYRPTYETYNGIKYYLEYWR